MLVQMEDLKPGNMKRVSNVSESVKAEVLERFGATLFEMQDHFQEALFSKDLTDDDEGDTLRLAQKKYALEHATVRRLRLKLREKEKLLMCLQKAIEAACETALDQQNKDRQEIECLHGLLSVKDDRSLQEIKSALKDLIKQKPEAAKGLAGDLANLLEEKLSDLLSSQEGKVEELQASLDCWKKRCRDLEEAQAKENNQEQQIVLKDAGTQELQLVQASPRRSDTFVEKLKLRLSVKECKVRQLLDRIKELEFQLARSLESQVDINLQRSVSQNYERARRKCIYLEDVVSRLKQEVQHLKNVAASSGNQSATESLNVKRLQKDLDSERSRAQALALELAQHRSKAWDVKNPRLTSGKSETEGKVEQVEKLKGVINELTAKLCKLQLTYQKLSSEYQGVRASSGTREVFDEFCLTHSAKDLDTKEVHLKLMGRIRDLQRKLTQCQEDLKVNEINKQFFEEKLNSMEERALKAELRLACDERKVKRSVEPQDEAYPRREFSAGSMQPKGVSPGVMLHGNEPELFELTQVLNYNEKGVNSNPGSGVKHDGMEVGEGGEKPHGASEDARHFVFANESVILEVTLANELAQCKLLSKRKFRLAADGPKVPTQRHHRGSERAAKQVVDLEALVASLTKELDQTRSENGILRSTRPSNVKYMTLLRKNKEVKMTLVELQDQLAKAAKIDPYTELSIMQEIMAGLRAGLKRWSGNSPWVQALSKLETCCANIEKKLSSTFRSPISETNLQTRKVNDNTRRSKAALQPSQQSVGNDSALAIKLEEQAKQLMELQTELSQKIQAITNLNIQLDRRDNELHLLHGHMFNSNANGEKVVQPHDFQTAASASAVRGPATLHCCEHLRTSVEFLQRQNALLNSSLSTAGNPKLLGEEEDLKLELCEVYKICSNYEQMLHKYTAQLGITFQPVRF